MEIDYGIPRLESLPSQFSNRGLTLRPAQENKFGIYCLVGVEDSSEEQHHQVEVIDESGDPLRGVVVIWGYPGGGPNLGHLKANTVYWDGAPAVLKGDDETTGPDGSAKHVFQSGGEDFWIWDIDAKGVVRMPSDIVYNLKWVPTQRNSHVGIKLRYQRRMHGVLPRAQIEKENAMKLAALESAVIQLESDFAALRRDLDAMVKKT